MILGIILLKKTYSVREYVAVVMISAGICICTLASSSTNKKVLNDAQESEDVSFFFWWIVGKFIYSFM